MTTMKAGHAFDGIFNEDPPFVFDDRVIPALTDDALDPGSDAHRAQQNVVFEPFEERTPDSFMLGGEGDSFFMLGAQGIVMGSESDHF